MNKPFNKLFIMSQPRSGSTLLQHILGSHSQVGTMPEPWLLLPLFMALRSGGWSADFRADYAYQNLLEFEKCLSQGRQTYYKAMEGAVDQLYANALRDQDCSYVLDKTPRYYHIMDEMIEAFPSARFVFLRRNPLAVMASIVKTNFHGDWTKIFQNDRKHDLLTAPEKLLKGSRRLGAKAVILNYEVLVQNPGVEINRICDELGFAFEPSMLDYGNKVRFEGSLGVDPKSIYQHTRPVDDYVEQWLSAYADPQMNRFGVEYLERLGRDTLKDIGYDIDFLLDQLGQQRKSRWLLPTASMQTLEKAPQARSVIERLLIRLNKS
jgi:hypothetical protein